MKIKIILIGLLILVTSSCNKDSGSSGAGDTAKQGDNGSAGDGGGIGAPVDQSKLLGSWKGTCQASPGAGFQQGSIGKITFSGSEMKIASTTYGATNCSGGVSSEMTMNFSYQIPSMSATDATIFNFNVTMTSVTQMVTNALIASDLNMMSYCGFTNWVANVPKDITNASCLSGAAANQLIYSIVQVNGSALKLGEPDAGHSGVSADQRHTLLSSEIFTKAP